MTGTGGKGLENTIYLIF